MTRSALRALAVVLLFAAAGAFAQPSRADAELKAAFEAAKQVQVPGPADVKLRDQAVLKLPAGYIYVPSPAAGQVLLAMGNRTDETLVGMVFPEADAPWFAVVRFVKEGYIKDDDAKDWNADDLLKSLREGTEVANEERVRRGIAAMEVIGWTEKPRYDSTMHRLVWSASTREKGTTGTQDLGVNYNTYALGRDGYLSLNLVTGLDQLDKHKPAALELLSALEYSEGRRYGDFNSSTDKVAAYGLAALVAGAAAKKLGLFAVLLAFLAKFAKVAIVAGGAALWGVAKLFGRKKPQPEPEPEVRTVFAATQPAPRDGPPPGAA